MKDLLLVGGGGMLGSIVRYLCSSYSLHLFPHAKFPWGTFFINVVGCFLIGLCVGWIEKMTHQNAELRLFCITGFLGGFTTFSAFGIETVHLLKEGLPFIALLYVVSIVLLGVGGAYVGLKIFA